MVSIDFSKEGSGYRMVISGHAGYAPAGQDIVCSAVSALFFATAAYLGDMRRSECDVVRAEHGYAELRCSRRGREAMRMAYFGLMCVRGEFPEHVSIRGDIFRIKGSPCYMGRSGSPSRKFGRIFKEDIHA